MEDDLNNFFNGRRPQFFLKMKDDLNFSEIKYELNFLEMEDDLNLFENARRPKLFWEMEDNLNFF